MQHIGTAEPGPPLDELERQGRFGHTVVRFPPRKFANAASIVQACRDAVMSPSDAPAQATHRQKVEVKAEVKAAAKLIFAEAGALLGGDFGQESTRSNVGDIDLIKHLRATCQYNGTTHPLLIVVDEVQDIGETLARGADARDVIKTNLKILNDAILDEQLPITTILAGLDPIRDTMQTLVSRPASGSDLQLTPIADEHIEEIFNDYLDIKYPREIPKGLYPPSQLREWAESCEGHVLFANQLGFRLQFFALKKLRAGVQEYEHDDHYDELEIQRKEHRVEYYTQQLPSATTEPRIFDVAMHIALANRMNHDSNDPQHTGPITWQCAYDLAEQALQTNPEETATPIGDELQTAMHTLQHKGIIRHMQPLDHFLRLDLSAHPKPVAYCAVPISTITTAILDQLEEVDVETRNRIDRNVQEILQRHKYNPGTRWQWNRVPDRSPIPRIEGDYEEPLAMDEPWEQQASETGHKK